MVLRAGCHRGRIPILGQREKKWPPVARRAGALLVGGWRVEGGGGAGAADTGPVRLWQPRCVPVPARESSQFRLVEKGRRCVVVSSSSSLLSSRSGPEEGDDATAMAATMVGGNVGSICESMVMVVVVVNEWTKERREGGGLKSKKRRDDWTTRSGRNGRGSLNGGNLRGAEGSGAEGTRGGMPVGGWKGA